MKHFSATLREKYSSWRELEKAIEKLPTTKEKGDAFEAFCYCFFKIKSLLYQVSEVFPSKEIPQQYKERYRLANRDSGVDGIIIRNDGKVIAYQSKFRTNRVKPTYEELTKFWSESRYCDYCCTVANCYSVTDLSDKHEQNLKILVNDFDVLDVAFFEELYQLTNNAKHLKRVLFSPHDYQKKIISDVISKFRYEDRGKIIAACGTGKTLTALWITEKMHTNNVLFLAPSIALIKQTLESWAGQANIPFAFVCVCSDNTVSENVENDDTDISVSQLGIPVTTNESEIAQFLTTDIGKRKYVFSTYQSTDKVANAMKEAKVIFDLTVFDEAHRTAGLRSAFSLALEDRFIPSKKRLFMTATERLVRPILIRRAQDNGEVIFSMDDEAIYGVLFSKYNFGDAIKDKTISDYKIIVAGVKESDVYKYITENTDLSVEDINEEDKIATAQSLYTKILLAKSMQQYPIRKIISFHSTIKRANSFASETGKEISLQSVIKEFNPNVDNDSLYINHISCKIDAGERTKILETFKNYDCSIISNAKCLTEGVDVPIIDCVFFADKKKSLVDIVQACGRALRTKKGVDKTAYFIVPILIPELSVSSEVFNLESFENVYNIIQSLRDQDNRLADWIDHLNKKYVRGIGSVHEEDPPVVIEFEGVDIQQFSDELYLRIATVNKDPLRVNIEPVAYGRGDRRTSQTRIFKTIGDYSYESFINQCVIPTMNLYKQKKRNTLSISEIRLNHNNVSHSKKLGLIDKENSKYSLTPLGKRLIKGKMEVKELFKRQLLRYSCSIEDGNHDRILFPYRACLQILSKLKEKKISFLEFAFCIYPLYDSAPDAIQQAIDDIYYLRENYPNLQIISIANRNSLLSELNNYYQTQISETDIWGTQPTTIKNQYMYFRNHLSLFDDIIEIQDQVIRMKDNCENELALLLDKDKTFEKENRLNLWAKYSEPFLRILLFPI